MAVLDNRVSTFLDLNGSFTKGKSHKDFFAFCSENKDLVSLRFNHGMAQMLRRMPLKFCNEVLYESYKLESQPGGFALAMRSPGVSQFRCGFRHACFSGVVDYLKKVETSEHDLQIKYKTLREMYDELFVEMQKIAADNPILKQHLHNRKELM